jgi:outer membrane lipoprotein-sorting protein
LKQCPQCDKYYSELKADDLALSDFANSMQPVITRIETNINKELETGKTKTISIRRNIFLKLAVAAVILFGIITALERFGIILDGAGTAWAKVSKIILEVRTITFNVSIGKGPVVICTAGGKKFKQELPNGVEAVFDYDKSKILLLNPNDKTFMNIELSGLPIMPSNLFENLKSAVEILKQCPDTIVKRLDKKNINNKEAAGIHVYLDNSIDIKIWYDIKDDIPVLIVADKLIGQTNVTFSDFNFDVIADESAFNLSVPENYTEIKSVKMDLKNLSEQDIVEGLKAWAGLLDNKFPEKLDLAIIQEHSKIIEQALNEKGVSDIEKALITIKIMRGLMFAGQLEVKWYYRGDNIKLGDANAAIFWYRPENSKTYRVLYGDLHFADVVSENLPGTP